MSDPPGPPGPPVPPGPPGSRAPSAPPGSVLGRLLVVDDNEMNRDMLSRRLTRRGHEVVTANDGQAALDMIAVQAFDVVLLDVNMPGIDGFETLTRLRQTHGPSELPVIMATARDQTDDLVQAFKLGANDYVTKPLDFAVVIARVQTQLALKRAVDRSRELEHDLRQRNRELERVQSRILRDLDAAAQIQRAGLPVAMPRVAGFRFAWAYRPCDELGGDSLNVFQIDDRHLGIYVLDVTGHGIPAALLAVTLNRQLVPGVPSLTPVTDQAADGQVVPASPVELASRLNHAFPFRPETRQFFTIVYGVLDLVTRRLRYVLAGHPGPIVVTGDEYPAMQGEPGFPIGIAEDADYVESVVDLKPGDRIYLFTDGLIEPANEAGDMLGVRGVREALDKSRAVPLHTSVDMLLDAASQWCGGPSRIHDDLTVLAIEAE